MNGAACMDLIKMRYFVETVREMSFTKAAQKLYVSQSNLSEQIKRIEEELSCQLLVRRKHVIALTPKGKEFYDFCEQTLLAYDSLCNSIMNRTGVMHIATCTHPQLERWFNILWQRQKQSIKPSCTCKILEQNDFVDDLLEHNIDMCFFPQNDYPIMRGLRFRQAGNLRLNLYYDHASLCPTTEKKLTVLGMAYGQLNNQIMHKMLETYQIPDVAYEECPNLETLHFCLRRPNTVLIGTVGSHRTDDLIKWFPHDYKTPVGWYYRKMDPKLEAIIRDLPFES